MGFNGRIVYSTWLTYKILFILRISYIQLLTLILQLCNFAETKNTQICKRLTL